jgi:hypothetical protein
MLAPNSTLWNQDKVRSRIIAFSEQAAWFGELRRTNEILPEF